MTVERARAFLPELLVAARQVLAVRADAVELATDLQHGRRSPLGGKPELKALEARLASSLEWFAEHGAQLRGWAPLLIDLPGEHLGQAVEWCWLEGEEELRWYHREDCGFAGRRPI